MQSNICNGHYMYGNTFIQPDVPDYSFVAHHNMAHAPRCIPPYPDLVQRPTFCPEGKPGCCLTYEESANKVDTPYTNPDDDNSNKCTCGCCDGNEIIRDPLMYNLIDITTEVVKTLKVTLYGRTKDLDKTIEMKTGGRYAVTYATEHGLIKSVGYLEVISSAIPDTCTRYINTNNQSAAANAYIAMDCSTEGHSDKRKIYVATIRQIEELDTDETPDPLEYKTTKERLEDLLNKIDKGELVFCKKDECCNKDTITKDEGSNNEQSSNESADTSDSENTV